MSNNHHTKQIIAGGRRLMTFTCLFAAILLAGCNKFLDVPPKDQVPQSVLFSDEQGFKEALTGVYIALDKPAAGGFFGLYTSNLSMGMVSTMAYDYDNA